MAVERITKSCLLRGQHFDHIEIEGDIRVVLIDCTWTNLTALGAVVILFGCAGRNVHRNFALLDKCHDSHVLWCEVQNDQPGSLVEDNINLYRSAHCRVVRCWINSIQARQSASGSGIMVDAGCVKCLVASNVILNTRNCGIGLAGGVGNSVTGNFVQQEARCVGGLGQVGIYLSNRYANEPFEGNLLVKNQAYWVRANGLANPFWWEGATDTHLARLGNKALDVPKDLDATYRKWESARDGTLSNPRPDIAQLLPA